MYWWNGSGWVAYNALKDIFFSQGVQHAVYALIPSASLTLIPPGNNYLADRARIDMIRVANRDPRFNKVMIEDYGFVFVPEDTSWMYTRMPFYFTRSDGTVGGAYFYHATNKVNLLLRGVYKYVIDTGTWEWVIMDKNSLYAD